MTTVIMIKHSKEKFEHSAIYTRNGTVEEGILGQKHYTGFKKIKKLKITIK